MNRRVYLIFFCFLSINLFSAENPTIRGVAKLAEIGELSSVNYIIVNNNLIDGAYVEIENLDNGKTSTAIAVKRETKNNYFVISSMVAANLFVEKNVLNNIEIKYLLVFMDSSNMSAKLQETEPKKEIKKEVIVKEEKVVEEKVVEENKLSEPEVIVNVAKKENETPQTVNDKVVINDENEYKLSHTPEYNYEKKPYNIEYDKEKKRVVVEVNGKELELLHHPAINSDNYNIVADNTPVPTIKELFTIKVVDIPKINEKDEESNDDNPSIYADNKFKDDYLVIEVVNEPELVRIKARIEQEKPKTIPEIEEEIEEEIENVEVVEEVEEVEEVYEATPSSNIILGALYYQIGAFSKESNAKKLAENISTIYPVVLFSESSKKGTVLHKVAVGPIMPDEKGVIKREISKFGISDGFFFLGK